MNQRVVILAVLHHELIRPNLNNKAQEVWHLRSNTEAGEDFDEAILLELFKFSLFAISLLKSKNLALESFEAIHFWKASLSEQPKKPGIGFLSKLLTQMPKKRTLGQFWGVCVC